MTTPTMSPARPGVPSEDTWLASAACHGRDLDVFFPETDAGRVRYDAAAIVPAARICAGCPVRAACLADARTMRDWHGIRAGLTGSERRRSLRHDCRTCGLPSPNETCRVCRLRAAEMRPAPTHETTEEVAVPVYDEVAFVDELPAVELRKHDRIAQALAAQPGQWGAIATYTHRGSAHSLASDIRTGRHRCAYRPTGTHDAEVRRSEQDPTHWVVYARYVGQAACTKERT